MGGIDTGRTQPGSVLLLLLLLLVLSHSGSAGGGSDPSIPLSAGPHLLLDDFLVEQSHGLKRRVVPAVRDLAGPVVTGKEDRNFQPYVTVLRDPGSRRFRMWY